MKVQVRDVAQALIEQLQEHPGKREALMDAAVQFLFESGLGRSRGEFLRAFQRLWEKQTGRVSVIAATPDGDLKGMKHTVSEGLEQALKARIELIEQKDIRLMGGLALSFGDERIDLSLRASLNRLAGQLSEPVFT